MSFEIICDNCGAPSGPSTGICPFCKSVLVSKKSTASPSLSAVRKAYSNGELASALDLFDQGLKNDPKLEKHLDFLLLGVKILIEAEGPSSKIRSLINKCLLQKPNHPEALDYLQIIDARQNLSGKLDEDGVKTLHNLIRRSPNNVHALFFLGAHSYWTLNEPMSAIQYLEKCVNLQPTFLRAWGCLAAIYEKIQNPQLAHRAYRQCFTLEKNPTMKAFFKTKTQVI